MMDEEFERIWNETRIKQREHNAKLDAEGVKEDDPSLHTPMLDRWRDGSDIT